MTSGVRRLTFSRAVVPLEIRFVLTINRGSSRPSPLLEELAARLLESRFRNHDMRIGIRQTRVVHTLDARGQSGVFRLGRLDTYGRPDADQRVKFRSGFALEPDAAVRAR